MLSYMNSTVRTLWKNMRNKEYRHSFLASHISNTIAAQIFMIREDRKWTQLTLAEKAGMKQSRISALEDPDFQNVEIATLRRLALAFDVGLSIRFVPFSEIAIQAGNLETSNLCIMDFNRDSLASSSQKGQIGVQTEAESQYFISSGGANANFEDDKRRASATSGDATRRPTYAGVVA